MVVGKLKYNGESVWLANYKQCKNRMVISSLADIEKLNKNISRVHFRKFVSAKLLERILRLNLKEVSFSKYAYRRLNKNSEEKILERKIKIRVFELRGRPVFFSEKIRIGGENYG